MCKVDRTSEEVGAAVLLSAAQKYNIDPGKSNTARNKDTRTNPRLS